MAVNQKTKELILEIVLDFRYQGIDLSMVKGNQLDGQNQNSFSNIKAKEI